MGEVPEAAATRRRAPACWPSAWTSNAGCWPNVARLRRCCDEHAGHHAGLLEHYLRATGWRYGDGGWHSAPPMLKRLIRPPCSQSTDGRWLEYAIEQIQFATMEYGFNISARLGLCAAAEDAHAVARSFAATGGAGGARRALTLHAFADRILRAAGVDPKRWEEDRHE